LKTAVIHLKCSADERVLRQGRLVGVMQCALQGTDCSAPPTQYNYMDRQRKQNR
jgi:hypothetical protein